MQKKNKLSPEAAALRGSAEARLPRPPRTQPAKGEDRKTAADTQRLLHELHVHQLELEMQNAELQESRNRMEALLEKYTDLYDFSPAGYFSLDEQGRILEANLTGAALLGADRNGLISRRLSRFAALPGRPALLAFLEQLFAKAGKQVCEVELQREDGALFWASLHGTSVSLTPGPRKTCRVVVSDITSLKQAAETQRRMEALAASNEELRQEIVRRQTVEKALKISEQHKIQMLEESQHMQEQLRNLSHRMLQTREDERKRISRELHDEITQTLVGINVNLEGLTRETKITPRQLKSKIARTQRLVEKSVGIVHQFARELRPTTLDDLGLIVTLHAFLSDFMKRTGIRVSFTTFAGVEELNIADRTALYRIAQEALKNVALHAHASRAKVSIRKIADTIQLEISDNGEAFDVARALRAKKIKRLGLIGMRERAEMLGGTFAVESAPGHGTTVRAQIPVRTGDEQDARP